MSQRRINKLQLFSLISTDEYMWQVRLKANDDTGHLSCRSDRQSWRSTIKYSKRPMSWYLPTGRTISTCFLGQGFTWMQAMKTLRKWSFSLLITWTKVKRWLGKQTKEWRLPSSTYKRAKRPCHCRHSNQHPSICWLGYHSLILGRGRHIITWHYSFMMQVGWLDWTYELSV